MHPVRITNKALKDCSARIRIKGARFLQIIRDVIYVVNIVIYHEVSVYHLLIHTFFAGQKHSLDSNFSLHLNTFGIGLSNIHVFIL